MATKELKTYSLPEMKDKYIGKVGTKERDEYEYELYTTPRKCSHQYS
jgi:hypothetical protein